MEALYKTVLGAPPAFLPFDSVADATRVKIMRASFEGAAAGCSSPPRTS